MSFKEVKKYFEEQNLGERVHEFEVSSATVELAAIAVGCEPERIAKTLSFQVNEEPILIVVAGDAKVDNQKYKATFGTKAKMLGAEQVEPLIGHPIGGVCPFMIKDGVKIYLDESLKRFDTIFPACGSGNSAVELSIQELEKCSLGSSWVDVCKGWQ